VPGRKALHRRRGRRIALAIVGLWLCQRALAADTFRLFPPSEISPLLETDPPSFRLSLTDRAGPEGLAGFLFPAALECFPAGGFREAELPFPPDSASVRDPNRLGMLLVTLGVLGGSAFSALGVDHEPEPFHLADEGFFERDEYSGGADKASHFVFYNGLARELGVTFGRMGYSRDRALWMGAGVAVLAGTLVEAGDGLTVFGFAWEDLLMDALGAGTAVVITRYGLDDLIGFRFGKVSAEIPDACCQFGGIGKDYSSEIYTADLKLEGAARRLRLNPGLARFLLFSMTYGSKGYRYSFEDVRQRNIGIELGLNVAQILTEIGVRDTTWWGRGLFIVANFFRIPFTSVGLYYDLNHGSWRGP